MIVLRFGDSGRSALGGRRGRVVIWVEKEGIEYLMWAPCERQLEKGYWAKMVQIYHEAGVANDNCRDWGGHDY